ncbi:MAG: TolC family protein [Capsulimonadaceae bacterium]
MANPAPALSPNPDGAAANPAGLPASPPATSQGPAASPQQGLTLADVVRIALGNNTGLVAARQRLQKAQELIAQVNAQARPQVRLDANDSYSSFDTTAPSLPSLSIQNPILPGGGSIPTIIDAAGNFPSGFIGFGGSATGGGIALTPGVGGTALPDADYAPASDSPAPPGEAPAPGSKPDPPLQKASRMKTTPLPTAGAAAIPLLAGAYLSRSSRAGSTNNEASSTTPEPMQADTSEVGNAVSSSGKPPADTNLNNYAARLSVIQFLDVFGLVPAARDAQADVRDVYQLDLERIEDEIALAAKNLFFNALLAQQQVATQQEQLNYANDNVDMAQSRFRHGFVSRLDVLAAQAAQAAAEQQLIAAQNQQNLAQADLAYLLGTDIYRQLNLVSPALPPLNAATDVQESTQTALANRPEIAQISKDIDESRRLVKIASSTLLPAVGLVASGEETNTGSTTQPYSYGSIGAMLYFPLDDGGATRSRVRSAKVDVQAQDLALTQLKLAVSLEVQQANLNIRNAQAQVAAAQTAESEAEEGVRIARERYKAGMGTFLDILNSLTQLSSARTNVSVADFLYQTSLAQLVRAMGGR